jgi:alpha-glucosidase
MTKKWWKEAVAYQIYPRSFMDSNADGIGDLRGVISKLDYLQHLGIDVIWLCPMYKSPQDDNGYDISDYQDIHHEFGSMADFDELLKEVHRRKMKLIIDLVINHTSDEHPWFVESKSSRNNPKRDWYIWRDAVKDGKPNQWESIFGGSAWEFDKKTEQYYMHLFSKKQPDLNWENHEMRSAIYDMIRWWLDKGIDGFRIDAISHMKKDWKNPDPTTKHMNVEGIHEYLEDICEKTFRRYDIMTVGEANGVTTEGAHEWVDEARKKLNMLFQFEHIGLWDTDPKKKIDLPKLKKVFTSWQKGLQDRGWNALYVENHDIPRIVSKWGDTEKFWRESATAIATMYFLMQGTPFIYQGQEIGMINKIFNGPDDFNDVLAKNTFLQKRKEGFKDQDIVKELAPGARDNARTPIQWSNVEAQKKEPNSVLNYYRQLIKLRKSRPLFVYGEYDLLMEEHQQIYAYKRTWKNEKALIVTNMTAKPADFSSADLKVKNLWLSNYENQDEKILNPFEARVYEI